MTKFRPGQSGNPGGRKPGTVNRQLQMLRSAADEIIPVLVEKAKAGDLDAMKLIITRVLPQAKPVSPAEPFTLPRGNLLNQVQAVLQQVASGEISPTTAAEIVGMISQAAKLEEVDQLRGELASLRNVLEKRDKKNDSKS